MGYTEREREIMNNWPVVTEDDVTALNDLFKHYIFYRKETIRGQRREGPYKKEIIRFWTSCCAHQEICDGLERTQSPKSRRLMTFLYHNADGVCPWCGRPVTMINLNQAGRRLKLRQETGALLLHAKDGVLYADAIWLRKAYKTEHDLAVMPEFSYSAGYRFTPGEVMELDYQVGCRDDPYITYEREKLGRLKRVQEPFKYGSVSFYTHESYHILNREVLNDAGIFKYNGFFSHWEYQPGGGRGYKGKFDDFVSYMTAYALYPRQMEMMVKNELYEPIYDLLTTRKRNAKAMDWNQTDPCKAFNVDKRELRFLLEHKPRLLVLECRNYVLRHWKERWTLGFSMDFCKFWSDPMEVLKFLKEYKLPPDKFIRYLGGVFDREHIEHFTYNEWYQTYRDYLEAAYALGWSMDHSEVLWPKGLLTAHDLATRKLAEQTYQEVGGHTAKGVRARMQKYEFELDGLRIIFPLNGRMIKHEGEVLHHCVGGYADRHVKGVLSILFLRKTENPATPYVTIEMHGNEIRQIHGFNNDRDGKSPATVHKHFLDVWQKWLKDGSPRNEDGTPKLPKKKQKEVHVA